MAAPLKIFGTAFALTLGAWRLQLRVDLDEVTDDAAFGGGPGEAHSAQHHNVTHLDSAARGTRYRG